MKGRPTKITDEKKLRLADFIRQGLTIKDACYGVGISTSTFNRLRAKDTEFDRLIIEATEGGWTNAEALAKYHYRGYRRKNPIKKLAPLPGETSPIALNSVASTPVDGKEVAQITPKQKQEMFLGLPVRFTYPSPPSDYYYNGNSKRVERFWEDGTLQSMSVSTWRRKYLHEDDDPLVVGWVF